MSAATTEVRIALRPTLTVLWVVWAVILFGGFLLGPIDASETNRIPVWCRMGSSLLLVLAGWTWYAALVHRDGSEIRTGRKVALLVTVGMMLGTLGDFFNADLLQDLIPLPDPVLGGLGSFLLGHIVYIAAFVLVAKRCLLTDPKSWWLGVGLWQFVAIVGWYFIVYRGEGEAALTWLALPYSMLLAGTAGVTTALAAQQRKLIWLALGAALFLISDLILGYRIFQDPFYLGGDATWLTYGPGQMFIVFEIGAMVALLPGESDDR